MGKVVVSDLRDGAEVGVDVGGVDVQLHHVFVSAPGGLEAFSDILEHLPRLDLDIAFPHQLSMGVHRGLAGHVDRVADLHNLREPAVPVLESRPGAVSFRVPGVPNPLRLNHFPGHDSSFTLSRTVSGAPPGRPAQFP